METKKVISREIEEKEKERIKVCKIKYIKTALFIAMQLQQLKFQHCVKKAVQIKRPKYFPCAQKCRLTNRWH